MQISIEQPPAGTDRQLSEYLTRMQVGINIALNQSDFFQPANNLPEKPRDGLVKYFTRALSAEVTGPGFYGYEQGIWKKFTI